MFATDVPPLLVSRPDGEQSLRAVMQIARSGSIRDRLVLAEEHLVPIEVVDLLAETSCIEVATVLLANSTTPASALETLADRHPALDLQVSLHPKASVERKNCCPLNMHDEDSLHAYLVARGATAPQVRRYLERFDQLQGADLLSTAGQFWASLNR